MCNLSEHKVEVCEKLIALYIFLYYIINKLFSIRN